MGRHPFPLRSFVILESKTPEVATQCVRGHLMFKVNLESVVVDFRINSKSTEKRDSAEGNKSADWTDFL